MRRMRPTFQFNEGCEIHMQILDIGAKKNEKIKRKTNSKKTMPKLKLQF